MKVKQVIVMRSDLKLRKGMLMAQASHASIAWLTKLITSTNKFSEVIKEAKLHCLHLFPEEMEWISGPFTKVILRVNSKEELLAIRDKAIQADINCELIEESTLGGEPTCIGIGPADSEKINDITGDLKLF